MKKVILLSGKIHSGKNQLAEYLQTEISSLGLSVEQDLLAKGVKNGCYEDFKNLTEYLNSFNIPELKTTKENFFEIKTTLTRILLQIYGTNIFRDRVNKNYWVLKQRDRIKESNSNVILITDVRFPNEINDLYYPPGLAEWQINNYKKSGFPKDWEWETITIRIERFTEVSDKSITEHESETALDNYNDWNYKIINKGTLNDLKNTAITIVKEEFLNKGTLENGYIRPI